MAVERIYVDANCWIAIIGKQGDYVDNWLSVVSAAERKQIEIYTSTYTLVEVQGGKAPLFARTPEDELKVSRYFDNDYIELIAVGYSVAVTARELVWDYRISNKDAIHIASAIFAKVPTVYTTDNGLIAQSEANHGRHRLPKIMLPRSHDAPTLPGIA